MKHFLFISFILSNSIFAADSISTWFSEGSVKGNVKYYYIETKKDKADGSHTSAHANAVGGTLNYTTGDLYGFSTGATFMTTNGFALPNVVDTSILGRDNGVRLGTGTGGVDAQESFSILGEIFVNYTYKDFSALYGRKVIKTPLIHAKEVRMLPSAVQGAFVDYKVAKELSFGASYLTHFKQRTSDQFINIVEHALGDRTKEVTGKNEGEIVYIDAIYKNEKVELKAYNYYAQDFMNSFYVDVMYKNELNADWSYGVAAQYINQMSIGHADDYFKEASSMTRGKEISVNAFGLKMGVDYKESGFILALSDVIGDSNKHDSLVLPWDGTPLFANMITSNDLFQSNYGSALNADSLYIGGSKGVKLVYTQTYDFSGIKGFKTSLSYLHIDNDKFSHNQNDYNAVVGYAVGNLSLALKGIWVRYNTSQKPDGTITPQDDKLTQYRVIANYKF